MIKWIRQRINYHKLVKALKTLRSLDQFLRNTGVPRQQRRYFWRDFSHTDANRDQVINTLLREAKKVMK